MSERYSIADSLREASQVLQAAGVPEARREAGSLLSFVIGKDRTFLISHADDPVDDPNLNRFRKVWSAGPQASRSSTSPEYRTFTVASFV